MHQKRIKNQIWGLKCGTKKFAQQMASGTFNMLFLALNYILLCKIPTLPSNNV